MRQVWFVPGRLGVLAVWLVLAGPPACTPAASGPRSSGDPPPPPRQAGAPARKQDAADADLRRVEELIVSGTNAFRAEQSRSAVKRNPELTAAADYFAKYMARTRRYGHTADGQGPAERARKFGYDYCLVSENIAYQYNSAGFATGPLAQGFVEGWEQSPGHRKNMLDPDVTETGVAVARAEDGTYYAVQMFGRPKAMQVQFKVTNRADVPVSYTLEGQSFPLQPRVTRTHTVCRPPKIEFKWGEDGGDPLRPVAGSHYVVTRNAAGRFIVHAEAEG